MEDAGSGRVLRVDLSSETVSSDSIPSEWREQFVGGKGLAARLLYDALDGETDPLGPDNVLVLAGGPLTGYLPGEDRYVVVTKSPQTNGFLDSYSGGSVPAALVSALGHHDAIMITGSASRPTKLVITNATARIESADDWWGLDIEQVASEIAAPAATYIGPAGEACVTYATIASDGGDHQASRGGAGAVMGAKRLKAIVFDAEPRSIPPEIEDLHAALADQYAESSVGHWHQASGTAESVDFADAIGGLATRGWQDDQFPGSDAVGIETVTRNATGRERAAASMPGDFTVPLDDEKSMVIRGGAGMTLGAGLGIDDGQHVAALAQNCDRLGLDLISAGNVIAWLIRAGQEGLVETTIQFGDHHAINQQLTAIAHRETELADGLAEGVDAAVARYGGDHLVPVIHGLELPNYHPEAATSMALAYATSDRGACHRRARPIEREPFDPAWSPTTAAREVIAEQNCRAANWCLITDDFLGEVLDDVGKDWLAAINHPAATTDLDVLGERVWTLTRLFNVRAGWDRASDELPAALQSSDRASQAGLDSARFEQMLDAYYAQREWGPDGRPSRALVKRVGLADTVNDQDLLADDVATSPRS